MFSLIKRNAVLLAWIQVLLATIGSLYFSDVRNFTPCILCWYQRIAMYPILILLTVALLIRDKKIHYYVLPLSLLGTGIALYHSLLYYNIIPEKLAPCVAGVSCTTQFINWFGFVSIPLLSFLAFLIISILMIINLKNEKNE